LVGTVGTGPGEFDAGEQGDQVFRRKHVN
jgi:hypothetical protein